MLTYVLTALCIVAFCVVGTNLGVRRLVSVTRIGSPATFTVARTVLGAAVALWILLP